MVEVRFDEEPFELVFSEDGDESGRQLASCHTACKLELPSGRYRVRTQDPLPLALAADANGVGFRF